MLGAIIGDMIGSTYEFDNTKDYNFSLFTRKMDFTDDSVLTFAVADWLIRDPEHTEEGLVESLVSYGHQYPNPTGGYGGGFSTWLFHPEHLKDYGDGSKVGERHPYNSWGNGSAMRVSPVGWCFSTIEETEEVAAISARVTHNHPEGIKGAQATAAAIFMARSRFTKEQIKQYITERFGYDLDRSWEELNRTYSWDSSCQGTVPEAIICFLESTDFEDAIRKAVSIGGDSDTIACITGGIAEAYYLFIPDAMIQRADEILTPSLKHYYERFRDFVPHYALLMPLNHYADKDNYWRMGGNTGTLPSRVTPSKIVHLAPDEIFVFGSNVNGFHGGGAARFAMEHFGAEWGKGEGLQGQSYAIPTMEGIPSMKAAIDRFSTFAKEHPYQRFYVTEIACGIAGYSPEEIAPMFVEAAHWDNVYLPVAFWEVILACSRQKNRM